MRLSQDGGAADARLIDRKVRYFDQSGRLNKKHSVSPSTSRDAKCINFAGGNQ